MKALRAAVWSLVLGIVFVVSAPGCGGGDGDSCSKDSDCSGGRVCREWACNGAQTRCYFNCSSDSECQQKVGSSSTCYQAPTGCAGQCKAQ